MGKLTIARELSALLPDYRLHHNHLVVDAVLSLFDFGSPNFIKHREQIWLSMLTDAIADKKDVIFTFNPESTVSVSFFDVLRTSVEAQGGTLTFIRIVCDEVDLLSRINSDSRKACQKLTSVELFVKLKAEGAFDYPLLPVDFEVNSSLNSPVESANLIHTFLDQ